MTYDPKYLGQNLTERTRKATQDFEEEMMNIASRMAMHNALNSSMTFTEFGRAGLRVLEREARDACHFVYNLTEQHTGEPLRQVQFCVRRMCENMMQSVSEKANQMRALGGGYGEIINRIRTEMERARDNLLADFANGMMGSERLKRDPLLNVINNQINSPGSIQQIGIGTNFSQSAFAQHQSELVQAIARALVSEDFARLNQEEKNAFSDTASILKEEAAKASPDVGKLKRWGARLVDLAGQIGMKVAADEIVRLLNAMFGG